MKGPLFPRVSLFFQLMLHFTAVGILHPFRNCFTNIAGQLAMIAANALDLLRKPAKPMLQSAHIVSAVHKKFRHIDTRRQSCL